MKINKNQIRSVMLDAPTPNDDGTYNISFSSEKGGLRPFGYEIVKHGPENINLDYASNGLSLLFNHDINQLIGRAENIRIDPIDKRGKATIRFHSDEASQIIAQKVKEGANFISYRYSIDDFEVVKSDNKNEPPTIYVTKSTPKEISIVSVPFDETVGINKSDNLEDFIEINIDSIKSDEENTLIKNKTELLDINKESTLINNEIKSETPQEVNAVNQKIIFIKENKQMSNERSEILALRSFAQKMDVEKEFNELSNTDKTTDEIRSALVDVINSKNVSTSVKPTNLEDSKEVSKHFSITRAFEAEITKDWSKAGFEKEVQRQWAAKQQNYAGGLIIPHEAFKSGTAMNTQTTGEGKEFVFPTYAGFVEMLRPQSVLINNGANVIGGLSMNYVYVQENAAPATYWVSENPGSDVTPSLDGLQTKTLSPKQLMAQVGFTRTQLAQSPMAFDTYISSKLVREFGIALDLAGFGNFVTGGVLTPQSGAPSGGILLDSSVPTVAIGTNGGNISTSQASILAMEGTLDTNNALNGFNPVYFTTPGIKNKLQGVVPPGLTYSGNPYWYENKLAGYKAVSTNNLPSTLTKGTSSNCHAVVFGDASQLSIGVFGDIILTLDPYTLSGQGSYRIVANQLVDLGLIRPTAFVKIVDAIAA